MVKFEGFFYEHKGGKWFFYGDSDSMIETEFETEVKNIRVLKRLKTRFGK